MASIYKELKKGAASLEAGTDSYRRIVFNRFFREWMALYEIEGISAQWTEYFFKTLWMSGQICAFKAEVPGEPILWFAPFAGVDYGGNDYPLRVNVVNPRGLPGYPKGVKSVIDEDHPKGEVAILRALPTYEPVSSQFAYYAAKIGEVQGKIDQNANQVVLPTAIPTDTAKANKLSELTNAIRNNDPFFATNEENPTLFNVVSLQGTYYIDKLIQYRKDWENEAKNQLGIDSSAEEKRERLLLDEVNSNNVEIALLQETIKSRLDAFAADVKLLGFDISFKSRIEKPSSYMEAPEDGLGNPVIERRDADDSDQAL